ncbi:MAG: hypothetical protein RMY34_08175 [Aulosira sp. DedQUE10]|nr:hypothetical protein [Aulosira sp. DedQUE10]
MALAITHPTKNLLIPICIQNRNLEIPNFESYVLERGLVLMMNYELVITPTNIFFPVAETS